MQSRTFEERRLLHLPCQRDSTSQKPADVALDVLFKVFKVTGSAVPSELRKIHDFTHIIAYKVLKNSEKNSVNALVESFEKAVQAEESDSE